jgi:hypothetical protein
MQEKCAEGYGGGMFFKVPVESNLKNCLVVIEVQWILKYHRCFQLLTHSFV